MGKIMDRSVIQNEAITAWIKNRCKGTCKMSTGTGKSFVAIKAILYIKNLKTKFNNEPITVLHLSERTDRSEGFKKQIQVYCDIYNIDVNDFYTNIAKVDYKCYQGYNSLKDTKYDLVICDEIHEALTPTYYNVFFYVSSKAIIGLSATIPYVKYELEDDVYISKFRLLENVCPIIYSYDLKTSITNKTSRTNNLFFIKCNLTVQENNYYALLSDTISSNPTAIYAKQAGGKRSVLMNNSEEKVSYAKSLIAYFNKHKSKSILFTTNTTVLKNILPNQAILGENKKWNDVIMHQFVSNLFYVIGSFKMLKQGNNIDNLDNCIILASNNSNIQLDTVQRVGRLRLDNENKGNVIVLYNEDTFEIKYLVKIPTVLHNTTPILCDNLNEFYDKYEDIKSLKDT